MRSSDPYSVVILAAGMSARMGKPKALLKLADGKSFLEQICERYLSWGINEIVVVTNELLIVEIERLTSGLSDQIKTVVNKQPELGRFHSVRLGMNAVSSKGACFLQNVDNPFVNHELLDMLKGSSEPGLTVIPQYNGKGGHPILIGIQIIGALANEKNHDHILSEYLRRRPVKKISVPFSEVLANINSREQYEKIVNWS